MQEKPVAREIPRAVIAIAVAVGAASITMMLVGAWVTGKTWDEQNNVGMLQTFFSAGWHVTADAIINGLPDPRYPYGVFVYGPMGEFLPHAINVLLGNESWGVLDPGAAATAGRHLGTALQALLGVGAAAGTCWAITRSWRWGLMGGALLAVTPLWLGQGMFNIKDSPAATGYTLATLGLVCFLRPDFLSKKVVRILGWVALVAGTVLAAGVRTALGLPIAAAVVIAPFVAWALHRRMGRETAVALHASRRFVEGLVAMVAAYLVLTAIYPKAYSNPINLGIKAVLDSALYPVNEAQLTAGTWMTQPVPWTYQPLWFASQLPLVIVIFCTLAVAWWIWSVVRILIGRMDLGSRVEHASMTTPVVLQLSLLPVGAILGQSTLYNGTRQVLFVVPAAAILATLGIRGVMRRLDMGKRGWVATAAWAAVSVGLVIPLVAQARLFPYNYTYFNAAAALAPIDGNWSTDYWRASSNELIRRTPSSGEVSCGTEQLAKGEFYPCLTETMFSPYLAERGSQALPGQAGPGQYWFIRENGGNIDIPPGCTVHDEISRPLFWRDITIGQVLLCDSAVDTGKRNMADPTKPAD